MRWSGLSGMVSEPTESFRFRYFQGECAVGIGHRSDIVADNRDVHVFGFLPAVFILDRTGHCLFSLLLTYFSGYFSTVLISPGQWLIWLATQLTFLQFFNPDFLRDYFCRQLNASLWTISVEIQFYVRLRSFFFYSKITRSFLWDCFWCLPRSTRQTHFLTPRINAGKNYLMCPLHHGSQCLPSALTFQQ